MENDQLLRMAIADFASNFFETHFDKRLVYHDLYHTRSVVLRSAEIAAQYSLSPAESFIVYAAAWFHDMGHLVHTAEGHEAESVVLKETCGRWAANINTLSSLFKASWLLSSCKSGLLANPWSMKYCNDRCCPLEA